MAGAARVRELTWRWLAIALLLVLPAWCFRDVLSGRRVFYSQDVLTYVEPKNAELLRALSERRLPLWSSAIACGVPFLAEIDNGVFNPFNALLVLGPRRAIEVAAPVWCALAGLFAAGFLRQWGLSRPAAAFGGLSYGLSGLLVFYFDNPPYLNAAMWLPLFLLCWHRALAHGSLRWLGAAAAVAALTITSGDLQTVYDEALLAIPYGFVVARVARTGIARPIGFGAGLGGATLALAAAQLLPTFALLAEAPRLLAPELVYEWSFHPARLLELVLPFGYGHDLPGSPYWGQFLHAPIGSGAVTPPRPWTRSVYVGVLPLLLLPWAFRERATRPLAAFFAAAGMVALLASFGPAIPVYDLLYRVLPWFNRFRVPSKLWVVVTLALAVLGALGAEAVLRAPRRAAAVVAGLGAALLGLGLFLLPLPAMPRQTLRAPALHLALVGGLLAAAVLVAAWIQRRGVRGESARAQDSRRALAGLLVALAALDLARTNGQVSRWFAVPAVAPDQPVAAARAILADAPAAGGPFRIFHHESLVEGAGWRPPPGLNRWEQRKLWDRLSLDWNHAQRWGLEEAAGYTVLQDQRPLELRAALRAEPAAAARTLARLGVRHLLLPGAAPPPEEATELAALEAGALHVYRLERALPRVFLAREGKLAPPEAALRALLSPDFDPAAAVLLESSELPFHGAPGASGAAGASGVLAGAPLGTARIRSYQPGHVVIDVEVSEPRYLVFAEARYQGWVATVDGAPRDTIRANFLMQAVPLRPGERGVELRYRPRSFRIGLATSALAWAALLVVLWRGTSGKERAA